MARPNFVCLVPDQFRFDMLGCAGHPVVRTPHLDALAAGGVRLDRCYTVQPMCMATRATWFTGLPPRGHRVRCNGIPLDPRLPTLPDALRRAGYRTHAVGKLHLNPWMPHRDFHPASLDPSEWPEAIPLWRSGRIRDLPRPYYGIETADVLVGKQDGHYREWLRARRPGGLEEYMQDRGAFESVEHTPDICWRNRLPSEFHTPGWASERAEQFLGEQRGSDRPFFLWVSVPDPHPPYTVPDPYWSRYRPEDMPLPRARREGEIEDLPPVYRRFREGDVFTSGRIRCTRIGDGALRRVTAAVCGMIEQWDAMAGRILRALEETGQAGDTVVVFMSDHGQMLGDHGLLNMPPTHLDGTSRVPAIWRFPGRFPAGLVSPALASHLDFAPTVLDLAGIPFPEGRVPPEPEAEGQRPAAPGRMLTPVLTGEVEGIQDSVLIENDEDYLGLRQRTIVTESHHLTRYFGEPYGELFDLREDPLQLHNRWDDPAFRGIRQDLQVRMLERFAETDPVLPRRMGHA